MNIYEKANFISNTLDTLFPNPQIPLIHNTPFTLLIAVMLSAQCTDVVVNRVSQNLFKIAPDPNSMSKLTIKELAKIIKPCGLVNRKANAIQRTSYILVEKFNSKVPETFVELESLPGVGHKTASVVMVQAFKKPAFPVDTHIARLAIRWGLSNSSNIREIENNLKNIFPEKKWHDLHIQIIEYGRKYCPARNHNFEKCVICRTFYIKN